MGDKMLYSFFPFSSGRGMKGCDIFFLVQMDSLSMMVLAA